MAGPQIVVEMDSDEAKLWAGFQRIMRGEEGMEKGMGKVAGETRKAAAEQKQLERAAKKVIDSVMTPQQRYNQKIAELNLLYGKSKLTVDQFRAALRALEATQQASNATVDTGTAALDKSAAACSRAFGPAMLTQVRGLLGALGIGTGIAGALQLINAEYDALKEKQATAAGQSMTAADAQIKFLRNLQPETTAERDAAIAEIETLSQETGIPVKDLYLRAGSAMSAKGAMSKQAAMAAVAASAKIAPEDAGEGEVIAGAALDLMKATGTQDAEAATGFLLETVKRARMTQTGQVAKNVVQPLIATMVRGDTAVEAASLFAAITTGAGDVRGEQSGTTQANLAQMLAEKLPKLASTRERIEAVQKDPELQKKIIPEIKGEAKTKGVVEQLLRGEGALAEAYQQNLATMPGVDQSRESFRQLAGMIQSTPLQQTARFGRQLDTTVEALGVADQPSARIGLIREKFAPILKQTGMGAMASQLEGLGVRASGDQLSDFMGSITEQEERLRLLGGETWQRQRRKQIGAEALAAEQETRIAQADVLAGLRQGFQQAFPAAPDPQMDQQTQEIRQQTTVLEEISRKLDRPSPRPMPGASSSANRANSE